jgi:hemolysin activation/secretion protein
MKQFIKFKYILLLLLVPYLKILTFCEPVIAQLPPRERPIDPVFPDLKKPTDVPIQIIPKTPLENDLLPPVTVKSIRFAGNTVFDDSHLLPLIQGFIGKTIAQAELKKITDVIREYYIENGYISSDAVYLASDNETLDPQNADLIVRVVEGRLGSINLIGPSRLKSYIRRRVSRQQPLDFRRLLEELRRLNADPLIENLDVKVMPSADSVNLSDLLIRFNTVKPYQVDLYADNYKNSGVGSFERGVIFRVLNATTLGDKFSLLWSNSNGSNALATSYSIPILKNGTTISIHYSYSSNQVIDELVAPLHITGTAQEVGVEANYPVLRHFTDKSSTEINLGFGLEYRNSQDKILGRNFPISRGANQDGNLQTTVFSFSQELRYLRPNDSIFLRSQLNLGLGIGSATSPLFDNGQFLSWHGDAQYIHVFKKGYQLISKASVQLADRSLVLPQEYSVGGIASVRAYPQDFKLSDNGAFASIGFKVPIYTGKRGNIGLMPFIEGAHIWNNSRLDGLPTSFADAGISLEYNFNNRLSVDLTWAYPLLSVNSVSNTFENSRILFGIRVGF